MISLHRRLLGAAFDELPPALRSFHEQGQGGTACGVMRVSRATGWLGRGVARVMRLPLAGDEVPLGLRVGVEGDRERWIRDLGGRRIESVMEARDGLLVEAFGPLRFGLKLLVAGNTLRFEPVCWWLGRLPLPRRLAPRVEAVCEGREKGWHVHVRIAAPVVGLLLAYEGEVTPS
jgi:hypothetical protein